MAKQQKKKVNKKAVAKAVQTIESNRTGIVLTGQVIDGKVVLDKACLAEISSKHAGANMSFVAVNAPFDPRPASMQTCGHE